MIGIGIGIGITVATVAILVLRYFRARRRRAFPAEGWLGIIALAGAEWLMFRGVEPVATYFTPIAWSAYILIADSAVLALTGRSRLHDERNHNEWADAHHERHVERRGFDEAQSAFEFFRVVHHFSTAKEWKA